MGKAGPVGEGPPTARTWISTFCAGESGKALSAGKWVTGAVLPFR